MQHEIKIGDWVYYDGKDAWCPELPAGYYEVLEKRLSLYKLQPNKRSWTDARFLRPAIELNNPYARHVTPIPPLPNSVQSGDYNGVTGGSVRYGKGAGTDDTTGTAALRYNSSKPESDYVFTYEGGVAAAFGVDHPYYETLFTLGELYRYPQPKGTCRVQAALDALNQDARDNGDSIVELVALTNQLGGIKYEPGNYLKGGNLRQYFQSAARHAESIANGVEYEPDPVLVENAKKKGVYDSMKEKIDRGFPMRGNFFFNVLMLVHCIRTGIGTDDRIRSPK